MEHGVLRCGGGLLSHAATGVYDGGVGSFCGERAMCQLKKRCKGKKQTVLIRHSLVS